MFARTYGVVMNGLDTCIVTVEADIGMGLPCFEIVGLPTAAVREAKERVRAAIQNSGCEFPMRRIVVNLAPAEVRKESSGLDLPIAMAILMASGQLRFSTGKHGLWSEETLYVGELSLEGVIKSVTGTLAMCCELEKTPYRAIVSAVEACREIQAVFNGTVYGLHSLADFINGLGEQSLTPYRKQTECERIIPLRLKDFKDVKGQWAAKRAMEIAAAGGHHLRLIGPPGAGKTMLAQRLPSILPPLSAAERIEVSKIYSVAGLLPIGILLRERPFRAPHHTTTLAAMVGGGNMPKPGEITLSHKGVLFLDETPEFRRPVLEVLRQPLEEGCIHIARAQHTYTFPARMLVVMAMNPCPCGWHGYEEQQSCVCSPYEIERYNQRLSGPLLDRIDMTVPVARPTYEEVITGGTTEESSQAVRLRVMGARERQSQRLKDIASVSCNGEMSHSDISRLVRITEEGQHLLHHVFNDLKVSIRSYDKIIRVAQTIADLDGTDRITTTHLAEALSYRS